MKLKSILLLSSIAACLHSGAQTWVSDSVTMGAGYVNDAFYSFSGTGAVSTPANNTWDLAFQMTPQGAYGSVSVLANSARGGDSVYSLHVQGSTKFATLTAADTAGKTAPSMALFNSDTTWNLGAFNRMNNLTNPFDFSWGTYSIADHSVTGDSLYIVKQGNKAYKVWIQKYVSTPVDSIKWIFRIANFDGTHDTTISLARITGAANRAFRYFSFANYTALDREPASSAWDVLFTRYDEITALGPTTSIPYPVTGVLSNYGVVVARAQHIAPDAAVMSNYTFSSKINAIGSPWKSYDYTTNIYSIVDSNTYFVKSVNTNTYYQLQFTKFTAATATSVFRKKTISVATGVANTNTKLNAFAISPNPAGNSVSVMVDAKEAAANTRIVISDMSGKTVKVFTVNVNSGVNAYTISTADFASGMYLVNVIAAKWSTSGKLTVQH